jgi:hypothetical protein
VAILTDGFWRTQFNADRSVLGRTFLNDGVVNSLPVVYLKNLQRPHVSANTGIGAMASLSR